MIERFSIENGETSNAVMLSCGTSFIYNLKRRYEMWNILGHIYSAEAVQMLLTSTESPSCPFRCKEPIAFDPVLPVKVVCLPTIRGPSLVSEACKWVIPFPFNLDAAHQLERRASELLLASAHSFIESSALSHEATVLTQQCRDQEGQQKSIQEALSRAIEGNRARLHELWTMERTYSKRLAELTALHDRLAQLKNAVSVLPLRLSLLSISCLHISLQRKCYHLLYPPRHPRLQILHWIYQIDHLR